MKYADTVNDYCAIARPASFLCEPWTLLLVRSAFEGLSRFDDFQRRLSVPRALLSTRLGALVEHGVFERAPYQDAGGRGREGYALTPAGRELLPVLIALRSWGDKHMAPDGPPLLWEHDGCGGTAQVAVSCDRCGEPLVFEDIAIEPGPGMPEPLAERWRAFMDGAHPSGL